MLSSPLQRAIKRGLKPGGDLVQELRDLDEVSIQSGKDAKAICAALRQLSDLKIEDSFASPLHSLVSLFQQIEGSECPAFEVMSEEGIPLLIDAFDARMASPKLDDVTDDLLFIAKILAMYGTVEGTVRVIEAAQRPVDPSAYMWHVIMSIYDGHPGRDLLFSELSDPIPPDFLGVSLLDTANSAAINGDLEEHPFDSPPGWERLQGWLADRDEENFSYAHSATAALPFISNPHRDQLLALAMDHLDAGIQMEAAWAAGKIGREAGLKMLARFCLDVNHSQVAQQYLEELDREDLIPEAVQEPSFQAQAEFSRWLAHPNELGCAPDALEVVDHRQLAWPPAFEEKPFWLIRYRVHATSALDDEDVGIGLVGSMTWCFFGYHLDQRPPEDAYAIHCYWEMEHEGLIEEVEGNQGPDYESMLSQWTGPELEEPSIAIVAEVSPSLRYPGRLVAVATARCNDEEGFAVLDGPRSQWYPASEQPGDGSYRGVLKLHVGRGILGFTDQPDRRQYLVSPSAPDAQAVIDAYEALLDEAESNPERRVELVAVGGELDQHFLKYVDVLCTEMGVSKLDAESALYDRILDLAKTVDESSYEDTFDAIGMFGDRFLSYIDGLIANGRGEEFNELHQLFAPYWDHNLGYGLLGSAAFKVGQLDVAESYFDKQRHGVDDYCRYAEMSLLAEIWCGRGDTDEARDLLVDCLKQLVTLIAESEYTSDRQMFAEEFQAHREAYLRLFPDNESSLSQHGIPADPFG